jgi:hypothetical protein
VVVPPVVAFGAPRRGNSAGLGACRPLRNLALEARERVAVEAHGRVRTGALASAERPTADPDGPMGSRS